MLKGTATLLRPRHDASTIIAGVLVTLVTALLVALAPIASNAALRVSPTPEFVGDGSPAGGPNPEGRPTTLINVVENLDTSVQYMSLQDAINAAAPGETLQFLVSSHAEGAQIVVDATRTGITLLGMTGGTTLTPLASTGTSGNARGWLLIGAEDVTVRDMTFDGTGFSIYQAIRILADGALIEDCTFVHLYGLPASAYDGRGIASVNSSTTVMGCVFADIKRIGIHLFGPSAAPSLVSGNTMTGKGPGDWIDYGVELGGGATALIENNTMTDCVGVALSDGSGSAGILITDFFAPGTAGTVRNNFVNDNSAAVALGYLPGDASVLVAEDNDFSANDYGVVNAGATVPDASLNWWGSNLPGDVAAYQDGAVDYTPWLHDGTDTGGPGFEGARATLYVDDDSPQTGVVGRVQEGVNSVTASTVNIMPGTYEEQILIDGMDVTLQGSGRAVTFIHSPVSLATHFVVSGNPNKSVVSARNSNDIRILDLTVDGLGRGNGNSRMYGIGFWNAGGKVLDCDITGIRQTPMNGSQHGVGVGAYNDNGGPYSLEIGGCDIDDFQKNGMALSGANLDLDVHDCSVRGSGDVSFIAQNGIQVSFGAGGLVRDCAISDIRYTPATFVASGLLVYQPGADVVVSGLNGPNAITDVQAPVSWYDGSGSLDGVEVAGTIVAAQDFGAIFIGNFTTALVAGGGEESMSIARPGPAPVDGADGSGGLGLEGRTGTSPEAFLAYNVDVMNSCLTGGDVANTVGVYAYTGGGPLSVSVTNSVIADWDYGLLADGAAASLSANANDISGNVTAGYDNSLSLAAQDAEGNWWGDQTGPSGDGPGLGDAANGAGIDVTPWLSNAGDSDPGCAFVPSGDNVITAGPGGCLSTVNTCLTVPVDIARTDAIPMRGFSVRVDLSPELELCLGVASIVEGSYLSDVLGSTTNFQVLDLGGGSYTVDGVILGSPCGAVDPSGTLFTLDVKRTIPDGTGTITITPIKARDCANAPVPVSPGAPLVIDIDTTSPVAIGDLAAAQQKTGNDSDGTTVINLTFTPPGDADQLLVYRAGFGNYPEYNDAPGAGSVPATPSYPPPAPWVLATTLPGVATSYADEVPTRDFWYFVVFSEDGCGNVSAVSNPTGGTLNYHLGDTHNGSSNCAGDNLVNTSDISFLGANYGVLLGASDPLGCLDVGPTTDFSVDARPTTDNIVDFEDLIVFAINYGLVSKPGAPPRGDVSGRNELALLTSEAAVEDLLVVDLMATGAGTIQGLSIDLTWNAAALEPIGVEAGELLYRQDRSSSVLSSRPGNVDVALLGVGQGLTGSGTVARVLFRVVGAGDPGLGIEKVTARDRGNRAIDVVLEPTADGAPRAFATRLGAGMPNPFRQATNIPMAVSADGQARVTVFDVLGRPIRTLLEGPVTAGERLVSWDGLDDSGQRAPSGLYLVRLEAGGEVRTRSIHLVR